MHPDSETLINHLRYSQWASLRLVEAARALPAEDVARDFGVSFGSIGGSLAHIYQADRIWWSRIEGKPLAILCQPGEDFSPETLAQIWPALFSKYENWVCAQSEEALGGPLEFQNLKGETLSVPHWQVLLHVVNHASYHRGQVAAMIRQLGQRPPSTDLVAYYLKTARKG